MSKSRKILTDEQLDKLICNCPVFWHRDIIILLADTGLRVAEIRLLKISDLWLCEAPVNALEVRAAIAKNNKSRTIPLTPRAVQAINHLAEYYWPLLPPLKNSWAFPGKKRGCPLTTKTFRRIVSHYGQTIIGVKMTPHTLRHTFATRLMRKCSIRVVQQLLGHSSLSSTQIYTHPNHLDLQAAIDALNTKDF